MASGCRSIEVILIKIKPVSLCQVGNGRQVEQMLPVYGISDNTLMIGETGDMKSFMISGMPLYFNSCLCHSVNHFTDSFFRTQKAETICHEDLLCQSQQFARKWGVISSSVISSSGY
jgi:hypothetical protein